MKGKRSTIVIFAGHGSRRAESNTKFVSLVQSYCRRHPESHIFCSYIELAAPSVEEALEKAALQAEKIILVPILLFHAGHAKKDLPRVLKNVQKKYPKVCFYLADVLGVHPNLASLAYKRASQTSLWSSISSEETEILYLGRGFQEEDSKKAFYQQVEIFAKKICYKVDYGTDCGTDYKAAYGGRIHPCFAGLSKPLLAEALRKTDSAWLKNILVVPHLLFRGLLMERVQEEISCFCKKFPQIKVELAPPLGIDSLLLDIIEERIKGASLFSDV